MHFRADVLLSLFLSVSVAGAAPAVTSVTPLDGDGWRLAPDAGNVGVTEKWWDAPRPEAKAVKVPWTIQAVFPGYAGYAWYWYDLEIPANPHSGGRYLLRFWDVDYEADAYVNGTHIGRHEGAQTPLRRRENERTTGPPPSRFRPAIESDGILMNLEARSKMRLPLITATLFAGVWCTAATAAPSETGDCLSDSLSRPDAAR